MTLNKMTIHNTTIVYKIHSEIYLQNTQLPILDKQKTDNLNLN